MWVSGGLDLGMSAWILMVWIDVGCEIDLTFLVMVLVFSAMLYSLNLSFLFFGGS